MEKQYKFFKKHIEELTKTYKSLQGLKWSLKFPVFLFDRDWFRLKKITIYQLAKVLARQLTRSSRNNSISTITQRRS